MAYVRSARFDPAENTLDRDGALSAPCVDTVLEYVNLHWPDAKEVRSTHWPQEARYFQVKDLWGNPHIRAVWFE